MNPDAPNLWRGPRWTLALLLACLGMLGPFSIDTYLPAFAGIARTLGATPVEMQQTLSAYLFGFAVMNLFHGALADSFGRRPVVLWGLALFTLASVGCALSPTIGWLIFFRALQGMSHRRRHRGLARHHPRHVRAGRRAARDEPGDDLLRRRAGGGADDRRPAVRARRLALDLLAAGADRRDAVGRRTGAACPRRCMPATCSPSRCAHLLRGYWQLGADPRFLALALASGVPFNGMFLYVLSAPAWLGEHLKLAPTEFFWFFCLSIGGIMAGAWLSGRRAGRITPRKQIRRGFEIMVLATSLNLVLNAALAPHWAWALPPVALFSFGWALMVPVVTLAVLDLVPERRGMASSLQAFVGSVANGLVAGVIAPLVMHSTLALALASAAFLAVGLVAWQWVKRHVG